MKTTQTWESSDLQAGIIVCRAESITPLRPVIGWDAKWTYQIGWLSASTTPLEEEFKEAPPGQARKRLRDRWVTVSAADGMVSKEYTRDDLLAFLNQNSMVPAPPEVVTAVYELARKCHNPP